MNEKAKKLFKNLRYTVTANFLVLGISVVLNLFVPKFLGVSEYGFWPLYVFSSSDVSFFHLGWIDGIYLKIGGFDYNRLDKENLGSQFWYLSFFQSFLAMILATYSIFFVHNFNKSIILVFTAIALIAMNLKTFVLYILQSTNRIREYAQVSKNDRYIYVVGVVIYLILGGRSYGPLIMWDLISKILITLWGVNRVKDLVFTKLRTFSNTLPEIVDNIKIGSNLMISNLANILIVGVFRLLVEKEWSIEVFGKLSFTLSISNMFMTFINAVGVVMFPLLRRTNTKNLPSLYVHIREVFVPLTFVILLFFNPVKVILSLWLPQYKESLFFMGILFPMIVYEGRMSLLVNTYLKTIRKERAILVSNLSTLVLVVITSYTTVFVLQSIEATVFAIILCLIFRCVLAETLLSKIMKIELKFDLFKELIMTFVFIGTNMTMGNLVSFLVFIVFLLLYLVVNFGKIRMSSNYLLKLMKE
ncbi:MAG: hypothetical protein L0J44_07225 [Tetragenococcus koreensis]|nr:hypothetical protein [Tetragenococcus koreensis]